MLGIENLKKAAKLGVSFGMQIEASAKDGFQVSDLFSFIDEVAQIPDVVKNKQAIVDEFKDLSPEERTQLVTYIETELVLENKKTEEVIEAGLEFVISVLSLVDKIKSVKATTTTS